jgi:hypothetical protein
LVRNYNITVTPKTGTSKTVTNGLKVESGGITTDQTSYTAPYQTDSIGTTVTLINPA